MAASSLTAPSPHNRDDGQRTSSCPRIRPRVSISASEHVHVAGGAVYPPGRAVVSMVSASSLSLRTNRAIIPSRREDGAIKHAREGGREGRREGGEFNGLRCLGCNYSPHPVMADLSISPDSVPPPSLLPSPLSRIRTRA